MITWREKLTKPKKYYCENIIEFMHSNKSICFFSFFLLFFYGCSQKYNFAPVKSSVGKPKKIKTTTKPSTSNISDRYYTVKEGDTLYSIGFRSGHGYLSLSKWNRIPSPYEIHVGQKIQLFAPPKTKIILSKDIKPLGSTKKSRPSSQKKAEVSSPKKKVLKLTWQWPIRGTVSRSFYQTGKKGIDIAAKNDLVVNAAAAGKVVYSGNGLIGYGNLLIIKHNYLYLSAYANNRRLLVNEGQVVKKGQAIAEVGRGKGSGPELHFEIRKNGKPVNPVLYLPKM